MGRRAAELLIDRIRTEVVPWPTEVLFKPELIVRESTAVIDPAKREG
jgi:DNA-binding LacI/PurR family transcriptional regulator